MQQANIFIYTNFASSEVNFHMSICVLKGSEPNSVCDSNIYSTNLDKSLFQIMVYDSTQLDQC